MNKFQVAEQEGKHQKWLGKTFSEMPAGHYKLDATRSGIIYMSHPADASEMVSIRGGRAEAITERMKAFFSPEIKAKFALANLRYARNMLLHGAPGGGKTMIVRQLAEEFITTLGGIVLWDIYPGHGRYIRDSLAPDRPVLLVFEEIDKFFDKSYATDEEMQLLSLLDGAESTSNTVVVATTNNIKDIPARIKRAGRFDEILEIGTATEAERRFYMNVKFGMLEADLRERIVTASDGLGLNKLAAIVKRVYCFDEPLEIAVTAVGGKEVTSVMGGSIPSQ